MGKELVAGGMFCSSFHCQQCLIKTKDSKEVPLCRGQAAEEMFFSCSDHFSGVVFLPHYPPSPIPPLCAPSDLVEVDNEGGEAKGDRFTAMNSGEDGIYCPNFSFLCWYKAAHQSHECDQAYLNREGDRAW